MSVRLYGRAIGHGSLAVVTRGFQDALSHAGLLDGVYALDKSGGSEEEDPPAGAMARDGVFVGDLRHVPILRRGTRHERHWVQVTPNSTHIPPQQLAAVLDLPNPHILSASAWGTDRIVDELAQLGFYGAVRRVECADGVEVRAHMELGPKHVEILTVRHGVSGFEPDGASIELARAEFRKNQFRCVHFSTTEGQRKGTLELLQAWQLFLKISTTDSELLIVLDHLAHESLQQRLAYAEMPLPPRVRLLPRVNMPAADMASFLGQQHALVAPSRGEGFSLGPLEARASGLPCISTDSTGNGAGHVSGPGVIVVPSGPLGPIDDGPGALAPTVDPEEITGALLAAESQWLELSELSVASAPRVAQEWSWRQQLRPLIGRLA